MKRNISILLLLTVILPFLSCKKFLEEQSQTDIVPRSVTSLDEMVSGKLNIRLIDPGIHLLDDDIVNVSIGAPGTGGLMQHYYTWQSGPVNKFVGLGENQWTNLFPIVLASNLVLDYINKVTGTTAEKDNLAGQAYLMRAFNYFQLVNFYGKPYSDSFSDPSKDPGVPLILSSALSLEGKARNTVAEVYNQIVDDLDKGIEFMERSGKTSSIYRMSPTAGYLLSSRVQLHLGNWEKAIEAASNVLSRKADLMRLSAWGTADQNSKPIISAQNQETIWAFGNAGEYVFQTWQELYNFNTLSDDLLLSYEPGDLRASIYVKNRRSFKRPASNAKIANAFRVSEALINRAEAHAQLNKLGQTQHAQLALNDLNTLRKYRFTTDSYQDLVITNPDVLLQVCYEEKRREFFGEECHRWFDLRRHGMPSITHALRISNTTTLNYVLEDHDPGYVFQIPNKVLEMNPKLTRNADAAQRIGH